MSTAVAPRKRLARAQAHPQALIEERAEIGARTRVWAFAHVLDGAQVGADCNLCDHTLIEGGAVVGDRVTIKCGVQVWAGVTIEDDVFVGPNATFSNDPFPRSGRRPEEFARTLVRRGASIGANATILPGVTIGAHAMIGAGAVVIRDVPARAIVVGNPGYIRGYTDDRDAAATAPMVAGETHVLPGGAMLHTLPRMTDHRGHLSFAELNGALPFAAARYFVVFGVPNREIRGEHAHRTLEQFLVCVHGSCAVRLWDGERGEEVALDRPELGLHVPAMVWTTQYKYSSDAVLLVLASEVYREEDYIRDIEEFQAARGLG
jgi:UDP-2-acetamido-3-amino-2,3-dideoxy-glucuronate N-acetyltransferase